MPGAACSRRWPQPTVVKNNKQTDKQAHAWLLMPTHLTLTLPSPLPHPQYMYYISLQRRRERLAAARRHRHHRHHHHHGSGHRRHSLRHSGGDDAEEQQPSSSNDREGRGSRGAGDPVAVVVSGGSLGAEIRPTSTAAAAAAAAAAAEAAAAGGEASSSARPAAAGGSLRGQRLLAGMGALLLVAHLPGSPWQLATQPARRRLLEAATGGVRLFKHMPHWA